MDIEEINQHQQEVKIKDPLNQVFSQLLIIQLNRRNLQDSLQHALELIYSAPLSNGIYSGGIFLSSENNKTFERIVSINMPESMFSLCRNTNNSERFCGQAEHESIISSSRSKNDGSGNKPTESDNFEKNRHGHYCNPILSTEGIIGVLILYTKDDKVFNDHDTDFLNNSTRILASLIEHINNEQNLLKAKEIAENTAQARSDFLANISHEIRTPMNAIVGLTNIVLQSHLDIEQFEQLSKVKRASNSLLNTINDILDFSIIETGKMELKQLPFQLNETVHHLADMFRQQSLEKKNELNLWIDPACPKIILGDPVRLEQVLMNMLNNANKFTESGQIDFHLSLNEIHRNQIDVVIKDTGIGISSERQSHIFDPFYKEDESLSREYSGVGLGLSISQRIILLMGSELKVTSSKEKGSTFSFSFAYELPSVHEAIHILEKSKRISRQLPQDIALEVKDKFALIIDDNQIALKISCSIMQQLGFIVYSAESSEEALSLIQDLYQLKQLKFDVILLDWIMPNLSRKAALEKIEQLLISLYSEKNRPNLVIQTASPDAEDIVELLNENKIKTVLPKPITLNNIKDVIIKLFDINNIYSNKHIYTIDTSEKYFPVLHNKKVLLVEDNLINQEVALNSIVKVGIQAAVANNGKEAIDILLNAKNKHLLPDLILMDIQMPIMDGIKATKFIRANDQLKNIPILAVTAHSTREHRQEYLNIGMNEFVSKPYEDSYLYEKMLSVLSIESPAKFLVKEPEINDSVDEPNSNNESLTTLNQKVIDKFLAEDKIVYFHIVDIYLTTFPDEIQKLNQAIKDKDTASIIVIAHSFKSSSAQIGAMVLSNYMAEIELLGRDNKVNQLMSDLFDLAKTEFNNVEKALIKIINA